MRRPLLSKETFMRLGIEGICHVCGDVLQALRKLCTLRRGEMVMVRLFLFSVFFLDFCSYDMSLHRDSQMWMIARSVVHLSNITSMASPAIPPSVMVMLHF